MPYWATQARSRAFTRTSLFELLGLRELVMALPDDDVGRALRLCLSSMLVKFMKAGPTAPRDGAEKRIARGVPSRMLADRAVGAGARPGGAGAAHAGRHRRRREISEGDARALPMAAGSAALVLSSPPYAGTYDYAAIHDARFLWLGLSREEVPPRAARRADGARRRRLGRPPGARSRPRFMAEVARVLRPGGRALLVVGDGVVDGRAENAPDGIAAAGAAVGLEPVARASQARPLHDRRLAEIFAGSARAASTCCCCRKTPAR